MGADMKEKRELMNSLGDDISWKSLYAVQNKIYASREEAIADAILWCSNIEPKKVASILLKGIEP